MGMSMRNEGWRFRALLAIGERTPIKMQAAWPLLYPEVWISRALWRSATRGLLARLALRQLAQLRRDVESDT